MRLPVQSDHVIRSMGRMSAHTGILLCVANKFSSFTIPKGPPLQADIKLCCFGSSCNVLSGVCAFSTYTCTGETETHWTGCTCTKHCG
jgi:hypothetical protein